jgi:hypothetical protein
MLFLEIIYKYCEEMKISSQKKQILEIVAKVDEKTSRHFNFLYIHLYVYTYNLCTVYTYMYTCTHLYTVDINVSSLPLSFLSYVTFLYV